MNPPAMRLRNGVCVALEEEADRLILESIKDVTSHEAKSDILTPWKERDRHDREVLASAGTVDPAVRRGMYHRKANPMAPHLNSRDGVMRPQRYSQGTDPIAAYEGYEGLLNVI